MAPFLAVFFALLAAVLGYLAHVDRMSAMAMYVVEVDTRLGVPTWGIALGLALVLGAWLAARRVSGKGPRPAVRGRAPTSPRPGAGPRSDRRPAPAASDPGAGEDWRADLVARARALEWEPGVSLLLDDVERVPFTLVLDRVTPERVRRAADAYARFLADIPLPPRARLRFRDCPPAEGPRHKQVLGVFRRHFAADGFHVVGQEESVDVLFKTPASCWAAVHWLGAR